LSVILATTDLDELSLAERRTATAQQSQMRTGALARPELRALLDVSETLLIWVSAGNRDVQRRTRRRLRQILKMTGAQVQLPVHPHLVIAERSRAGMRRKLPAVSALAEKMRIAVLVASHLAEWRSHAQTMVTGADRVARGPLMSPLRSKREWSERDPLVRPSSREPTTTTGEPCDRLHQWLDAHLRRSPRRRRRPRSLVE
jgi:hypothetical protein